MIIQTIQGRDTPIDSTERVLIRVQDRQWRIQPTGGVAVWEGEHSRSLSFYGGRAITGKVWIGKTEHEIRIEEGG